MGERRVSQEAMEKATGHTSDYWFPKLDQIAKDELLTRTEIVMTFWRENDEKLSAWWAQMTAVEWERVRGRRKMNQSCSGLFQMSAQKTLPCSTMSAWDALISTDWLEGMKYEEGYEFDVEGAHLTVRAVRPGKLIRIWWEKEGNKSVLEIMFIASKEKCTLRFQHQKLAEEIEIEIFKKRWKSALGCVFEEIFQ